MNRALAISLVAMTCLWSTASFSQGAAKKSPPQTSNTSGRYQLFQGSFQASSASGGVQIEGVFMIDSETGRTWIYSQKSIQGKGWDYYVWIPIVELKADAP